MKQARNIEEIFKIKSQMAKTTEDFRRRLDKYLNNEADSQFFKDNFRYVYFQTKFVLEEKKQKELSRLKLISMNLDEIERKFNALPPKYYPDSLKKNLADFKLSLNSTINKVASNLRYHEYFKELHSFTYKVSNFIRNAIKALELEQNSKYCSEILNNVNELKRLVNSLEKEPSVLSNLTNLSNLSKDAK